MTDLGRHPSVSAIVRTHNRSALLALALESLLTQTYKPHEVLVVDNASADDTAKVVQEYKKKTDVPIHYIYEPVLGASRARYAGMKAAQGEILAWTDDDCIADSLWLEKVVQGFLEINPTPSIIAGNILLRWEKPKPWWFQEEFEMVLGRTSLSNSIKPERTGAANGANISWPRSTNEFLSERIRLDLGPKGKNKEIVGEDLDISFQVKEAGGSVWYIPEAKVHHFVPAQYSNLSWVMSRFFIAGKSFAFRKRKRWENNKWDNSKRLVKAFLELIGELFLFILKIPLRAVSPLKVLVDLTAVLKKYGGFYSELDYFLILNFPKIIKK